MGGRMGLFRVCQGKPSEVEENRPEDRQDEGHLVGPGEGVMESRYFSDEELKYYEALLAEEEQRKSDVQPPKRWQAGEFLGQGSFGRVIFAANMDTGELFAVKQIPLAGFSYETVHERIEELQQEVDILSHLNHKNIVRYQGTSRDSDTLNIFLEYVAGGSIASLLSKYGKFNESLARVYTRQIVEGLEYLHYHNIIHRDIKGANVLVNNEGVCKLADFGAAKKIYGLTDYTQFKSLRGTINWMAPEVMKQEGHGRFADIWSLGCTVLEMLTGKPPWHYKANPVSDRQIQVLMHVASSTAPPELPPGLSLDAENFILSCLKRNPGDRPNVRKLLMHPFIAGVQSSSTVPRMVEIPSVDVFASTNSFSSMKRHNKDDTFSFVSGGRTVMPVEESQVLDDLPPNPLEESKHDSSPRDLSTSNPNHNVSGPFGSILPSVSPIFDTEKPSEDIVVLRRDPNESCKSPCDSYTNSNSSSSGNGSLPGGGSAHVTLKDPTPQPADGKEPRRGESRGRTGRAEGREQQFRVVCVA